MSLISGNTSPVAAGGFDCLQLGLGCSGVLGGPRGHRATKRDNLHRGSDCSLQMGGMGDTVVHV